MSGVRLARNGEVRIMLRLIEHLLCVRHQPQEVWNAIIPFSM